ncbi:MAG: ATP-binding protein [Gammaproteobacteria bacterium]
MSELYFRLGEPKGFTAIDLADKKEGYANPIRELLQNSLDASREAGNKKCEINIYIEEIPLGKIPHISEYKKVLKKAIKTAKDYDSFNDNSRQRVALIDDALKQKKVKVLMFSDNGIGMSQRELDAILTGFSRKGKNDEKAGGSYGVGHLSSYSLSSLRYVLYASKRKDGKGKAQTLFTGQPILAGYNDGDAYRGNTGRIVKRIPRNEMKPTFAYPSEVPGFIRPKIDMLENGTVVVVLGLSENWSKDAEYAIVSNFFHAIARDALSVTVHQNGDQKTISIAEVARLIDAKKDGQHAMGENILSGKVVYHAWQAVTENDARKTITLGNSDKVDVYIKNDHAASKAIVLVRNGMVIARHDSMLSGANGMDALKKNSDFEPFTAIVDVDQKCAKNLFKLVKRAESSSHNELQGHNLNSADGKHLKDLFAELSEKIKGHLNKVTRESTVLRLFGVQTSTPIGQDPIATPLPDPPRPRSAHVVISRSLKSKNSFRYTDADGKFGVKMRLRPSLMDAKDDVYLSIRLGEDNDKGEAKTYLDFIAISMDGRVIRVPADNKKLIKLGRLYPGKTYDITADVKKPKHIGSMKVALLPTFGLKRKPQKSEE